MKKESNEEDSDEKKIKYYQKLPDNRKNCYLTHKK